MKKKIFDRIRIIFSLVIVVLLFVFEFTLDDISLGTTTFKYAVTLPIALVTYILISYDMYVDTFNNFKNKNFIDEVTLTIIATIAAFAIGEFVEGLAVAAFFQIGEKFEEYAVNKSRDSIKSILNLRPDKVNLIKDDKEIIVDPYDVNIGDIFIVKPGERVPLDGVVIKGNSMLDTSSMTGESLPRKIKENENIISGTINISSPLYIRSTKIFYDSTINKIIELVENSSEGKTKSEKFITKFAKIYTPIVVALAVLIATVLPLCLGYNDWSIWANYLRTAASFLVISCPCALVLSVPMAYFVSLGEASKVKVLVKGSYYLELLGKVDTLVMDKTGTITKGNFEVSSFDIEDGYNKDNLFLLASYGEYYSNHPIAKAILKDNKDNLDKSKLQDYKEIEGHGISVLYENKLLLVGNDKLMNLNKITFRLNSNVGTIIYVAYDNKFIGSIVIKDTLKETSINAIKLLKKDGIKTIYMLTGDNENIASDIALSAGIDKYYANLLPLDKVEKLKEIQKSSRTVGFIGDGINDVPSLISANVGISMGGIGSDVTIESSDAVVMDDDLMHIVEARKISRRNNIVVYENIIFALAVKIIVMILALIPNIGLDSYIMWLAIFADVGVTFICVLNSLRLMLKKTKPR